MSKMIHLIEEMRERLSEIAATEQTLVQMLRDALNRVDQKLLQDVRSITADHEMRRGEVLNELYGLASRMGELPAVRETLAGLEHAELDAPSRPVHGRRPIPDRGRRQATDNIQNELNYYFKNRAASR